MDRDSLVGIVTRYGLVGPGIESGWQRDFPHPSTQCLLPTEPPVQWVPGTAAETWHLPPTPSRTKVKEIVEICLYPSLSIHCLFYCELYVVITSLFGCLLK